MGEIGGWDGMFGIWSYTNQRSPKSRVGGWRPHCLMATLNHGDDDMHLPCSRNWLCRLKRRRLRITDNNGSRRYLRRQSGKPSTKTGLGSCIRHGCILRLRLNWRSRPLGVRDKHQTRWLQLLDTVLLTAFVPTRPCTMITIDMGHNRLPRLYNTGLLGCESILGGKRCGKRSRGVEQLYCP